MQWLCMCGWKLVGKVVVIQLRVRNTRKLRKCCMEEGSPDHHTT